MRPLPLSLASLAAVAIAAAPLAGVSLAGAALDGCEGEGPKTALSYTEDAKRAYDAAMEEYNAHNWIEAQALLREVTRNDSYPKFARRAEVRSAGPDYEQGKDSDAIRESKGFIPAYR